MRLLTLIVVALHLVGTPELALARVAVVLVPGRAAGEQAANRYRAAQRALMRSLARLEIEALSAAQSMRGLEGDPAAQQARQRAAAAVSRARKLRRGMEYDKAAAALEGVEQDAVDGLLRFVAPQLLGEIHLQRGLLLLPTRPTYARKALRRSFGVHPREIGQGAFSPKILEELRKARAAARRARQPTISVVEASTAAEALAATHLILPTVREGVDTVRLEVFDAKSRTWRRVTASASEARLAVTLRPLLGLPPPEVPRSVKPSVSAPASLPILPALPGADRAKRPLWPWFVASAGAAAAVLGVTLWAISSERVSNAEDLAGRQPLVEYAADAEWQESSARRFRTGAIVSLVTAGVAVTAAVAGWLGVGSKSHSRTDRAGVSVGVEARGVVVQFP